MPITFSTSRAVPRAVDAVGVHVFADGPVPRALGLDRQALASVGFEGKLGQVLAVPDGDGPVQYAVGLGPQESTDTAALRRAAAAFARAASRHRHVATSLAEAVDHVDARAGGQAVAEGFVLACYRFDRFRSSPQPAAIEEVTLTARRRPDAASGVQAGADRGAVIATAVGLARDLVNTPGGELNARDLAAVAQDIGARERLTVEVMDEQAIAEARLGGLMGVNRGSDEPPRLIKLTYAPRSYDATVALVGKGITFDSGGLSLKTGEGMMAMKDDMGGAAAVLATMSVLRALRLRVRVIGYMCCTDNMPGPHALKPGDVLTIRNGKTVEVLNTDAEGRLVLADGLSLAVEEEPDAIVDVATLTGACIVALGNKIAGVFGNHEGWVNQVRAAAKRADESVWPLPLPGDYRKLLDSEVADLKNIGSTSGLSNPAGGGALTAGLFLQEFVGNTPWVHMDIAGPARSEADDGWVSRGGTGFGVRTLVELLSTYRAPDDPGGSTRRARR